MSRQRKGCARWADLWSFRKLFGGASVGDDDDVDAASLVVLGVCAGGKTLFCGFSLFLSVSGGVEINRFRRVSRHREGCFEIGQADISRPHLQQEQDLLNWCLHSVKKRLRRRGWICEKGSILEVCSVQFCKHLVRHPCYKSECTTQGVCVAFLCHLRNTRETERGKILKIKLAGFRT